MELFEELLIHALRNGKVEVRFPVNEEDISKICEGRCYKLLCEIKDIIQDTSLDDPECFWRIEKIVTLFEREGIDANGRHDFG